MCPHSAKKDENKKKQNLLRSQMVLSASAEGIIVLFRLATQDMKQEKMIHGRENCLLFLFQACSAALPPFCCTVSFSLL